MQVYRETNKMQLQIKAQDAGVKRGTLNATTNKGIRCRCIERHIRCNYK